MMNTIIEITKIANNFGWHSETLTSNDIFLYDNKYDPTYCIPLYINNNGKISGRIILAEELYMVLYNSNGTPIGVEAANAIYIKPIGCKFMEDSVITFTSNFSKFIMCIKKEA